MCFVEKIKVLLEKNMTDKAYKLWEGVSKIIPSVWDKPTSSTKKYHKKFDGRTPNIDEHTYEMLYAATKLFPAFNIRPKTSDADVLMLAIAFHDSLKYGKWGDLRFCDMKHDREAAEMIKFNKETFVKILSEDQFEMLEEAVRFHTGRWSTDVRNQKDFDFKNFGVYTLLVHVLDMMSSQDLIQTDVRDFNEFNNISTGVAALG
jgi:hypothetical protein